MNGGATPFNAVRLARPGRSVFDLSHEVKLTCDMGELIPIMCEEVLPGDTWQLGCEMVIRFQPLVAPVLHSVNAFVHYFFVPTRILWSSWETFITGGRLGDDATALPTWNPTDGVTNIKGTLWDYLGYPVDIDPDANHRPIAFGQYAYNKIYNDYYRDQTQIAEIALTAEDIQIRAWEKDFFTSALPWQQRGTTPALPVAGTVSAVWAGNVTGTIAYPAASTSAPSNMEYEAAGGANQYHPGSAGTKAALEHGTPTITKASMDANTIDLSTATTYDIADFRLAHALQVWMERNARAGARYTEALQAHFGVAPKDERLQRAEYIGGLRSPVIVSEVLQTSGTPAAGAVETDTPQGTMVGHGLVADRGRIGSYTAQEHGYIVGILSVMPRPAYSQGLNRQWLRRTRYDFYFPEFANLSEQPIERAEIYLNEIEADNETIFGYIGRYDEYRFKQDRVCAEMRDTYDYWHIGRQFGAAPTLNQTFIECVPRKDIFAVQDEDGLLVNVRNVVRAVRPMPIAAEPSLQ